MSDLKATLKEVETTVKTNKKDDPVQRAYGNLFVLDYQLQSVWEALRSHLDLLSEAIVKGIPGQASIQLEHIRLSRVDISSLQSSIENVDHLDDNTNIVLKTAMLERARKCLSLIERHIDDGSTSVRCEVPEGAVWFDCSTCRRSVV